MAEKICSFKDYMKCKDDKKLSKTRKKINRKRKDGSSKNVYGWAGYGRPPNLSGSNGNGAQAPGSNGNGGNGATGGDGGGGMGESYRGYYRLDDEKDHPKQIFKNSQRGLDWIEDYEETDQYQECPECEGTGLDDWREETCMRCGGKGQLTASGEYIDDEYEDYEEDAEEQSSKKSQARALYQNLQNQGMARQEIIDQFQSQLQLTPSSSVAYYERIAKEFGHTEDQTGDAQMPPGTTAAGGAMGGMPGGAAGELPGGGMGMGVEEPPEPPMEKQEWDDPDRQGAIRTVDGAHLVYKRQTDDGSFEELWIIKQGDKFQDELDTRRDILAGTDIPVNKTKSDDGSQRSDTWNVGNIQYIEITGLPN